MVETDEEMAKLFALSQGEQPSVSTQERRTYDRFVKAGMLTIFPCKGNTVARSLTVSLRDISRGGIGFVSQQRLEMEGAFIVALKRGPGKATVMLYEICRLVSESDGFHVGAHLRTILRDNEIRTDDDSPLHRVGRATLRATAEDGGLAS